MQNASHIRRYVLLRQRDGTSPTSRWSLERISPAPAAAPAALPAAQTPAARR